jgi:phage terminase Nu1 subunit (DNA packaging protein)
MASVSSTNRATKSRLAEILGLTTRQLTNLVEQGMPREVEGRNVWFDLPSAVQWYARKLKEDAREGDEGKKKLSTRRLELEVQMQEYELAKMQGSVIVLDYMEQQLSTILQRLRAVSLNAPGKHAPAMVGLRSIAEAQTRLESLSIDLISALSETADDPELDEHIEEEAA